MKFVNSKNKATMVAVMAVIATMFSGPVLANNNPNEPEGIQVTYLGIMQSNPVFEVTMKNNEEDYFLVKVVDAAGTTLYSEKLKGKNITRRYRIDTKEELENGSIRFEIKTIKSKKTDVYALSVNENVTREMAVSKLK